jgi:hypothetical protein
MSTLQSHQNVRFPLPDLSCSSSTKADISRLPRQICTPAVPPKRIPVRHRLLVDPQRRRRLETRYHYQGDPPRYPVSSRRTEPRFAGASGRVQPVQEGSRSVRKEGQEHSEGKSGTIGYEAPGTKLMLSFEVRFSGMPCEGRFRWLHF